MFDLLQQPVGVKMNRDICIDNQPIYSGLFFFGVCLLHTQKPAAKWAVELEQKSVKSQECLRIDFGASNFHYSTWIQQNSSWICIFDAWNK